MLRDTEDLNKVINHPYESGDSILLKCPFSPNQSHNIIVKIQADFSVEIDKLILTVMQKYKGPQISKTTLKKNKVGGSALLL